VKVFFDTNVLVAAFATRGLCADLFAHVLLEHELVVGEVVLVELRQKLRTKLKLPKKTIDEIEALLRESSVIEGPVKHLGLKISDPDDEWVVASAVAGQADVLVTGDAAVLKVAARAPLRIITPRGLWDLLREHTRPTKRRG
jgi:putative PIN family toxin of toxin-antitoxin system